MRNYQKNELWHSIAPEAVLDLLEVNRSQGLTEEVAKSRLESFGANELIEKGGKHPLLLLWEQLTSVMVLILVGASLLSLALAKYLEAGAILAIVLLFALLGFIQEYRAERAIAALKRLAVPLVRVIRDGGYREVAATELVPGDMVAIEAGNVVPADLRIVESANLRIQEAALTGESEPVEKGIQSITQKDIGLGDRTNMGYMGTQVTYGRGVGVVVATGMHTELGRIAELLQGVRSELTPLQQRLDKVGKQLAAAGIIIALLVLVIGTLIGEGFTEMLVTGISIAVAVIPEGLPAVVTLTLALGAQRMLKRHTLIRRLPAVETLGSVTTICSDKTGTLTENKMTVTVVDVAGHRLEIDESLRHRTPSLPPSHPVFPEQPNEVKLLLLAGALCNDAQLKIDGEKRMTTLGDPTEGSLLVAAACGGIIREEMVAILPRVAELPFDSERKRMTTVHELSGDLPPLLAPFSLPYLSFTKGSVDGLLTKSSAVWQRGEKVVLDEKIRSSILSVHEELAGNGMRVLGVAFRESSEFARDDRLEEDLIFIGMVGIIDPPRSEVRAAVATCVSAGIRPVMITGDHPSTARYIAHDLGIVADGEIMTGSDLDQASEEALLDRVERVSVFARVSPEHKLRIVNALQRKGHVVAMTGDGVNDAPALRKADIGVAMGITGTDVSKEAADMVLQDDNFSTIVAAVEEGRVIYDNLRRFVSFAVAGNIAKVGVMLLWPVLILFSDKVTNEPIALLPLQLLWLNLMTDGLLGLSIGVEKAEKNVMARPPIPPSADIFSGGAQWHVIWIGAVMTILTLIVGFSYYSNGMDQWQTMMFTLLAVLQIFQALGTRSSSEHIWKIGFFSNPVMIGITGVVLGLQILLIHSPIGGYLGLKLLSLSDWLICLILGVILFLFVELEKWRKRS